MDRLAARAREELAGFRRALAEAGHGREEAGSRGTDLVPASAPGAPDDAMPDVSSGRGARTTGDDRPRLRRTAPRVWPHRVREAHATLELPLGSDLEAVAAAHAGLVARFSPDRFADLPDGGPRLSALRARLDEAERVLTGWLRGESGEGDGP